MKKLKKMDLEEIQKLKLYQPTSIGFVSKRVQKSIPAETPKDWSFYRLLGKQFSYLPVDLSIDFELMHHDCLPKRRRISRLHSLEVINCPKNS